jgi:xanthine dehydrogenase accessory factor
MLDIHRKLVALTDAGRRVAMATIVESRGSTPQREGGRMLIAEDGETWFTIGGGAFEALVIDDARACLREGRSALKSYSLHESGEEALGMACGGRAQVFIEVPALPTALHIYGAGHVARVLAAMAVIAGFRPTVIDDREAMLDPAAFPPGTTLRRTDRLFRQNPLAPAGAYVVLVTRCHDTDQAALELLADGDWAYLGMIGSRRKVRVVLERLRVKGVPESTLARVHAPIGVPIGSHAPAEVAVSILAELIAVRNGVPSPGRTPRRDVEPAPAG